METGTAVGYFGVKTAVNLLSAFWGEYPEKNRKVGEALAVFVLAILGLVLGRCLQVLRVTGARTANLMRLEARRTATMTQLRPAEVN